MYFLYNENRASKEAIQTSILIISCLNEELMRRCHARVFSSTKLPTSKKNVANVENRIILIRTTTVTKTLCAYNPFNI